MSSPRKSVADHMSQEGTYGDYRVLFNGYNTATTAALITAGGSTISRVVESLTIPPMTSPVTGAYLMYAAVVGIAGNILEAALEPTALGILTLSGNVFSGAASMPTRSIYDHTTGRAGAAVQMPSVNPMLLVTTTLVAATPVITITYTNQAGVGGRTATLTLPTNALINSAFRIAPHLQSGDTGILSVQNISTSAGSAGVLSVRGLIPLVDMPYSGGAYNATSMPVVLPISNLLLQAGDVIAFYRSGSTSTASQAVILIFSPES